MKTYSHILKICQGLLQVVHVANNMIDAVDAVLAQLGAGGRHVLVVGEETASVVPGIDQAHHDIPIERYLSHHTGTFVIVGIMDDTRFQYSYSTT